MINLTTEELAAATDYCGVRSGRDVDKFKETGLTREKGGYLKSTDDKRGSGVDRMQSKKKSESLVHIICFWQRLLQFMQTNAIWTKIIVLT